MKYFKKLIRQFMTNLIYEPLRKDPQVQVILVWALHIFTARVRSTTGRYCFHRCLSVHRGGGGVRVPPPGGGTWPGTPRGGTWPPRGYPDPPGGYLTARPPRGGTWLGTPRGGTWTPWGGTRPPGGYLTGYPPLGGVPGPPRGGVPS